MATRSGNKKPQRFWFTVCIVLILSILAGVVYCWHTYWPSREYAEYSFDIEGTPVFYKGSMLPEPAVGAGDSLKLSFDTIKEYVDPAIYYEEETQSVIVTTENKVLRMKTDQLSAVMNEEPFNLQFPVHQEGDVLYIPVEPLKHLYQVDIRQSSETGVVILHKAGDLLVWGAAAEDAEDPLRTRSIRSNPSVKASIYADIPQTEKVMIWGEQEGWYYVQRENGLQGYMNKQDLVLQEPEAVVLSEREAPFVPWKPVGGRINLTWQQVYGSNPDPTEFGSMPGLNVISPQWFMLADEEGNITQSADSSFVNWANEEGLQLWALFNNGFDPDRTSAALSTYEKRMYMVKQIVSYVQMYNLQGINVDFENVYLRDKEVFVQFMRELTPFLHEQGAVVSIDVTIRGGSETYSLFLDRQALGEIVDYMMVMTYDEHWGSSPRAGSVASLPWVEDGIVQIMLHDDVPSSKLILGVPFYTRIWTETVGDGRTRVSSRAVGMNFIENLLEEQGLTPTLDENSGQHYVEYAEDEQTTIKIWIEDEMSMAKRIELVNKYDLAGVASWSRGLEKAEIWPLIQGILEQRP